MKVGTRLGSFILLLLLLQVGSSSARPNAAKQQNRPQKQQQLAYEKLSDGAEVWRLWLTRNGIKKPEIALLKLSEEMYAEFSKDSKKWINEHHILSRDGISVRGQSMLRLSVSRPQPKRKTKGQEASDDPIFMLIEHDPTMSNYGIAALTFDRPKDEGDGAEGDKPPK
jgi:hypothetical protein